VLGCECLPVLGHGALDRRQLSGAQNIDELLAMRLVLTQELLRNRRQRCIGQGQRLDGHDARQCNAYRREGFDRNRPIKVRVILIGSKVGMIQVTALLPIRFVTSRRRRRRRRRRRCSCSSGFVGGSGFVTTCCIGRNCCYCCRCRRFHGGLVDFAVLGHQVDRDTTARMLAIPKR
jgi:hypothetical protein